MVLLLLVRWRCQLVAKCRMALNLGYLVKWPSSPVLKLCIAHVLVSKTDPNSSWTDQDRFLLMPILNLVVKVEALNCEGLS